MRPKTIKNLSPLGFNWPVSDPFLFCVHHDDRYPKGNGKMGPDAPLTGRNIGQDFTPRDGWRMYHGTTIPGFPAHPHRGFETVTVVLKGFVDHSDSHGQAGRYGEGDVQWMTAGAGLQHSEMFPLLNDDSENHLELFQIWLNLPASKKFSKPHFKMLWSEDITKAGITGKDGTAGSIRLIAGSYNGLHAPDPAPDSWAADPENGVDIWLVTLDGVESEVNVSVGDNFFCSVFNYGESELTVNDERIPSGFSGEIAVPSDLRILNNGGKGKFLFLKGRRINEPVYQYGPFVMNSEEQIRDTYYDFQRTQFGGWPWESYDHVHDKNLGRFARHSDGREEIK
ncbi:MAG: pirin family protein [Ignavibacteriaceae bacterium]|nr:pirin family protein [Ignavibacteriaceae bacterium]